MKDQHIMSSQIVQLRDDLLEPAPISTTVPHVFSVVSGVAH